MRASSRCLTASKPDHAPLHRVTHRFRHLAFRKVLQQAQHLDVPALAVGKARQPPLKPTVQANVRLGIRDLESPDIGHAGPGSLRNRLQVSRRLPIAASNPLSVGR